jgi:hypothetical protein
MMAALLSKNVKNIPQFTFPESFALIFSKTIGLLYFVFGNFVKVLLSPTRRLRGIMAP